MKISVVCFVTTITIIFKSPQLIILKVTGPSWALMFYNFIVSSTDGTKEIFKWVVQLWALKSDRRGHESWLCRGPPVVRYWTASDRIMSPALPKDVHTLIPEPVKRLLYLARETLYMGLSKGSENREIFPDYLGGPQYNHQGPEETEGGGTQPGRSWLLLLEVEAGIRDGWLGLGEETTSEGRKAASRSRER